jgi:alpha-tubulin suppressor-like RCC1 family protein
MPSPRYYSALAGLDMNEDFVREQELIDQYVGNQLWSWGINSNGQLGDNSVTHRSSPVQTVSGGTNWKVITCGYYHTTTIKTDGTLWLWGANGNGQLGTGSGVVHRSSPVQEVTASKWKTVGCGGFFTAAIKTDGTLWLWGANGNGQLGTGSGVVHRSSPVQEVTASKWKTVTCGYDSTAAIKTDGTLWTWGNNNNAQLGLNDTTQRSSPTQITGGGSWKQVGSAYQAYAAIKTDGTLWTWGWNNNGVLGDGTTTNRSSPVQTISTGNNWDFISTNPSGTHFSAIKTDGTLWTWGRNTNGGLGVNDIIHRSSPVQITGGGTNWKLVLCGNYHSAAIKTDGTLWTWGRNTYGNLGDNTRTHRSSPVQTVAGGSNWKNVSLPGESIIALTFTES